MMSTEQGYQEVCAHAGRDSAPSDSHVADGPSIDGVQMPAPVAHSDERVSTADNLEESETYNGTDNGSTKPTKQDGSTGECLCHDDSPCSRLLDYLPTCEISERWRPAHSSELMSRFESAFGPLANLYEALQPCSLEGISVLRSPVISRVLNREPPLLSACDLPDADQVDGLGSMGRSWAERKVATPRSSADLLCPDSSPM